MIVINGESASGKSTAALNFIERHKDRSLYILMERDSRLTKLLYSSGFDYAVYGNGHLVDIKYRILERGGLMSNDLEYVVVDSLGMIKDPISQMAKIAELEKNRKRLQSEDNIDSQSFENKRHKICRKRIQAVRSDNKIRKIEIL